MTNIVNAKPGSVQSPAGTLVSLGAGAGRIFAQIDDGAGAKPRRKRWVGKWTPATTTVIGEQVDVYLFEAPDDANTEVDGDVGVADAAISSEDKMREGGKYVGSIGNNIAATSQLFGSRDFDVSARYYSLGYWNGTADAFSSTESEHDLQVFDVPDEIADSP